MQMKVLICLTCVCGPYKVTVLCGYESYVYNEVYLGCKAFILTLYWMMKVSN
jgi:hypothetical protein